MSTSTSGLARDRVARTGGLAPTRDRRPGWAALALSLIVGLGALGGYLYLQAGTKTPIVVVVAEVPAGHTIVRTDLSTISVSGPLTTIAARDLPRVVGHRAAVTLLPGTPLQRSMLSESGAVQPGQAQVGLAVSSGQVPAEGVRAGDTVEVLQLPGSSGGAGADPAQVLVPAAVVWSAQADPARAGGFLLTVTVPAEAVAPVASASGAGQIAVVRVSPATS